MRKGAPLSLAAALAVAMPAALSTPTAPAGTPASVAQTPQDGTKAPVPTPSAQIGDLAFLNGVGAPRRVSLRGCPWPGRRLACARRSAGMTRRMR